MFTGKSLILVEELLEAIYFFSKKGWSPATSTNYSVRTHNPDEFIISRTGVDKSRFKISDFISINTNGIILSPRESSGVKSSAETEIHTAIYQQFSEINCVLHTHSVPGTVLSHLLSQEGQISFQGLEILKGIEGNNSHDLITSLPIVPNSQNMTDILCAMEGRFSNTHGFLISGHGLYSWGKDIATAKRHIETFEFLFECYLMMRRS
jgi:methylthioribulose-1-phosphate dehydratase